MTAEPSATPSGDERPQGEQPETSDVFAGLTPIDVVDGELIPRRASR